MLDRLAGPRIQVHEGTPRDDLPGCEARAEVFAAQVCPLLGLYQERPPHLNGGIWGCMGAVSGGRGPGESAASLHSFCRWSPELLAGGTVHSAHSLGFASSLGMARPHDLLALPWVL